MSVTVLFLFMYMRTLIHKFSKMIGGGGAVTFQVHFGTAVKEVLFYPPSLLSRDVSGYRVVGCPKCIDDKKYKRNAFIFNFVFVFYSSTDHTPYEPLIQKIGEAFRTYEVMKVRTKAIRLDLAKFTLLQKVGNDRP